MSIPNRNKVVHDTRPSVFPGPYEFTDQALKNYNIPRDLFGTTEVKLPNGASFRVKDYQYELPDGSVGMHLIPVNDYGNITAPDHTGQPGYYLIDEFLREKMGLKENEPIYALVNFFHPEQNSGTLRDLLLSPTSDKIQFGYTHLGAYYGRGYTTNAPMLYHTHRFGVNGRYNDTKFGYPANVLILSLEGVPQAVLNKNLQLVDTCLNSGVMFPNKSKEAYKDSKFRMVDINTALMFYRDWIRHAAYLRTDDTWYTYCAAHKSLVATVAMNLPHNQASFQEVYGAEEGKELFEQFILFYNCFVSPDPGFDPGKEETYFEPLWKKQGFTAEQISPFTKAEYDAYEEARLSGKLGKFKGKQPLGHSDATAWAAQSSAEIIYNIIQVYADMLDVGPIITSTIVLGFLDKIHERMGISKFQYLWHAMPFVQKLMIAHARIYAAADPDNYLEKTFKELYAAFGGSQSGKVDFDAEVSKLKGFKSLEHTVEAFLKKDLLPESLAAWALIGVVLHWKEIVGKGTVKAVGAYEALIEGIQKDLQEAREMLITEPDKVEFNTPPAIAHLIGNGIYHSNPLVTVREVCTIADYSDMQFKKEG